MSYQLVLSYERLEKPKNKKRKEKNTTPQHDFGAYRIHGWDVQKQPFNSNMGFGPTTLRFPFAHALYKELTHFCYWNVLGGGQRSKKEWLLDIPWFAFSSLCLPSLLRSLYPPLHFYWLGQLMYLYNQFPCHVLLVPSMSIYLPFY